MARIKIDPVPDNNKSQQVERITYRGTLATMSVDRYTVRAHALLNLVLNFCPPPDKREPFNQLLRQTSNEPDLNERSRDHRFAIFPFRQQNLKQLCHVRDERYKSTG